MPASLRYSPYPVTYADAFTGSKRCATGTSAGQAINNTATVGYSVGAVAPPDVSSNRASFVVDMLVNLSVAELGGSATVVVPGATGQVTTFTVTNT